MAAIHVNFGDLEFTAVLANCRRACVMHTKVYETICQRFPGYKAITKSEEIFDMILTISGFPIPLKMHLESDLYVDIALGMDFLGSTKANLCFDVGPNGTLSWIWHGKRVETDMLSMDLSRNPISGANDPPNTIRIDRIHLKDNTASECEDNESCSTTTSTTHPKEAGASSTIKNALNVDSCKKSRKKRNKKKSQNPKPEASNARLASEAKSEKNDSSSWRTVFIADRHLVDMLCGDQLAYYGVRWESEHKYDRVTGELLERKEKSLCGFLFEALSYVFEKASEMGVRNLRIVLDNEDVIQFMADFQNRDSDEDEFEAMKPAGLYYFHDVVNFSVACMGSQSFDRIKYEYVSPFDNTHKDMVILREQIEDYIANTPL